MLRPADRTSLGSRFIAELRTTYKTLPVASALSLPLSPAAALFSSNPPAPVDPVDPGIPAGPRPATPAAASLAGYSDREIQGEKLSLDIFNEGTDDVKRDLSGWARTFSAETRFQDERNETGQVFKAQYAIFKGTLDTPNYGAFSLEVSPPGSQSSKFQAQPASRYSRGIFSLVQRRMPFSGGVVGDHFLGLHTSTSLPLIANQYRIGISARGINGVSGKWVKGEGDLMLSASSGQLAELDAYNPGSLRLQDGKVTVLGLQKTLMGNEKTGVAYAIQASTTNGIANTVLNPYSPRLGFGYGVVQALSLRTPEVTIQANALHASVSDPITGQPIVSNGYWADGRWRIKDSPVEHRLGVNSLPRGQYWLGSPTTSAAKGGYYKWRWQSPTLSVDTQIDHQAYTETGLKFDQGYASIRNVDAQGVAWGAQTSLSSAGQINGNVLVYRESPWMAVDGTWRAFVGANKSGSRYGTLGLEASGKNDQFVWNTSATWLLPPGGMKSGADLSANVSTGAGPFSLNLGVREYFPIGGGTTGQNANASLNWHIAPGWSLSGTLSRNLGAVPLNASGPSGAPLPPGFNVARPIQNFFWLSLRYDFAAGRNPSFLQSDMATKASDGSSGGGSVEGYVFLDANNNALLDGGEVRVADINVVLDGKFGAKTDVNGRYEFPYVANGDHTIEIVKDNLPLPWTVEKEKRNIFVKLRGRAEVNFGANKN